MYTIPKEVQSEVKLTRFLYLKDFLFLMVIGIFTFVSSDLVHSAWRTLYYFYCGLLALWLMPPTRSNPGVRNWRAYFFWLMTDFKPYGRNIKGWKDKNDEKTI